jgi:hypothetical protein
MVFKIEDVPPPKKPKDDKEEDVEMPDENDKPEQRRRTELSNEVVKREYFAGNGGRVFEFRMG